MGVSWVALCDGLDVEYSLSGHREGHIGTRVHPVRTEVQGTGGGLDARNKARTGIRDSAGNPLGFERAMAVVHVASAFATCQSGVEDHYCSTVDDQAHGRWEV